MRLYSDKIQSREALISIVNTLKSAGKRIVFTNGCFDILHAGHVDYLQRAKKHGDVLVLGLNTDASVKRLKGESRPVQNQDARAFVLSGLACIDYVTLFDEDTPVELISALQPDIHVKGGDYSPEQLPEYAVIKAYGGDVVTEAFVPGYSTTSIIERS